MNDYLALILWWQRALLCGIRKICDHYCMTLSLRSTRHTSLNVAWNNSKIKVTTSFSRRSSCLRPSRSRNVTSQNGWSEEKLLFMVSSSDEFYTRNRQLSPVGSKALLGLNWVVFILHMHGGLLWWKEIVTKNIMLYTLGLWLMDLGHDKHGPSTWTKNIGCSAGNHQKSVREINFDGTWSNADSHCHHNWMKSQRRKFNFHSTRATESLTRGWVNWIFHEIFSVFANTQPSIWNHIFLPFFTSLFLFPTWCYIEWRDKKLKTCCACCKKNKLT